MRKDDEVINRILSATQYAFWENDIPLKEMARGEEKPKEHVYSIGDTVITVTCTPVDFNKWKKAVDLNESISAKIAESLRLDGLNSRKIDVSLYPHNNVIVAEITRPEPALVTWKEVSSHIEKGMVLVGRDKRKRPVFLDLETAAPGFLVVGASGVGKTNLMRLLLAQVLHKEAEIYLACLKGPRDWEDLLPYAKKSAFTNEDAEIILQDIQNRVNLRNESKEGIDTPIVLFWDEASEPVTDSENQKKIGILAKTCRSSNTILIVGTQTADSSIHADVRNNLRNRFAFKAANSHTSYLNTGMRNLGSEKLVPFECLFIVDSYPERVSTPRADENDIVDYLPSLSKGKEAPTKEAKKLTTDMYLTLSQLAEKYIEKDVSEDGRRTKLDEQLLYIAAIHYWRTGKYITKDGMFEWFDKVKYIEDVRYYKRIYGSRHDRIAQFVGEYSTYIRNQDDTLRSKVGGIFSSRQEERKNE